MTNNVETWTEDLFSVVRYLFLFQRYKNIYWITRDLNYTYYLVNIYKCKDIINHTHRHQYMERLYTYCFICISCYLTEWKSKQNLIHLRASNSAYIFNTHIYRLAWIGRARGAGRAVIQWDCFLPPLWSNGSRPNRLDRGSAIALVHTYIHL